MGALTSWANSDKQGLARTTLLLVWGRSPQEALPFGPWSISRQPDLDTLATLYVSFAVGEASIGHVWRRSWGDGHPVREAQLRGCPLGEYPGDGPSSRQHAAARSQEKEIRHGRY